MAIDTLIAYVGVYDNVEDADFEDITPKPPVEDSGNPPA